jgi:hypothetical protein
MIIPSDMKIIVKTFHSLSKRNAMSGEFIAVEIVLKICGNKF